MPSHFGWKFATCACLFVGALLRFAWIEDVEYKDDEDQLFHYSQAIPATHLWPAIGTTSGVREIRHPVLGVWSFAILAGVFHLHTPLALTRSVAGLSLIAVALLFWFAWRLVPAPQRDIWLWTAALASVNLAATIYARKIWIPDLLTIFCVVLLIAWSHRHTRIGALIWGIDGALIGQVHMTGFFYAAAVLIGTTLFARTSVRWRAWLVGSAWGTIPALPWLHYLWTNHPTLREFASTFSPTRLNVDFFRMAFEMSLSQSAEFNVGSDFQEYLAYPALFGVRTQAAGAARFALHSIGAIALVFASVAMLRRLRDLAVYRRVSDIHLCFFSVALTGILVSVAGVPNTPHHHLMVFPLEFLWLPVAVLAFLPRPWIWLTAVWLGSAVSTVAFLQFIHHHCGAPNGEYGVSYRCQEDGTRAAPSGVPSLAAGGSRIRSPNLEALMRPGLEGIVARMLGRGELLPGSCKLTDGQIDHTLARGTYACDEGRVTLQLVHWSKAPENALRTADFAVVLVEGSPPAGFLDAIRERVRREEPAFEWLLEAGPTSSVGEAPGPRPYGDSPPVLTSRQVLLRMVGGAVILLLLSPWWGARVREAH